VAVLGLGVENSEEAQLEGFILHVNGRGDFIVNNLRVQTTPSTIYEGGTIGDLIFDTHVIVHGRLANGILQAEHISFEGTFELESNVVAIDSTTRSLTLAGLPNMTVRVDDHTAIRGQNNLLTFGGIALDDHLVIHGRASSAGLLATELERSDPSSRITIQGPVRSVSEPHVMIAGASINTSGIPDDKFLGADGIIIGRSAFFQGLTTGSKVSLRGNWANGMVTWTSARLKTTRTES
jgi:hypothetical protein